MAGDQAHDGARSVSSARARFGIACASLFALLISTIAISLAGCGGGGGGGGGNGGNGGTGRGRANGRLVLTLETVSSRAPSSEIEVFFSVMTADGDPVTNLDASDFIILENGERNSFFESTQEILPKSRVFRTYTVLLLDLSGSILRSGALPDVRRAAESFVDAIFASNDSEVHRVAVFWFDGRQQIFNALQGSIFSNDRAAIVDAIRALQGSVDLSTNLNGAIVQGMDLLDRGTGGEPNDIITQGVFVLFTDGTDNAARVSEISAVRRVQGSGHHSFAIGLGGEINTDFLRAVGTDGFEVTRFPTDARGVFLAIAQRIEDLANRFYLLKYCSPKRAGTHDLTIEAQIGEQGGALTTRFDARGFTAECGVPVVDANVRAIGGAGHEIGRDLAIDRDGDTILCGEFAGRLVLGGHVHDSAGGSDGFVAKLSSDGSPRWSHTFGSAGDGEAASAVVTTASGDVVVSGTFSGSVRFAAASSDDVVSANDVILTSRGGLDAFVVKYDTDGRLVWARTIGGPGDDGAEDVAIDIGGAYSDRVAFGAGELQAAGPLDGFVARFSALGNLVWARGFGSDRAAAGGPRGGGPGGGGGAESSGEEYVSGVAVDELGGVFVTGVFTGVIDIDQTRLESFEEEDAFVARLASDSSSRWAVAFGGPGPDLSSGLASDENDNAVVSASFFETVDVGGPSFTSRGAEDLLVCGFAGEDGRLLWSRVAGGAADDAATSVATSPSGEVRATGRFEGTMQFSVGGGSISSHDGSVDAFLLFVDGG